MTKYLFLLLSLFVPSLVCEAQKSDTLLFSGQASAWANYNFDQDISLAAGVRYIPQINFQAVKGKNLFDAEKIGRAHV